jgi:hypothetical protein
MILHGNPLTRAALDHAQVEVIEYDGAEISLKGAGGPPVSLVRSNVADGHCSGFSASPAWPW